MKNIIISASLFCFLFFLATAYGQVKPIMPIPNNVHQIKNKIESIKANYKQNSIYVEYPMQSYYHMPYFITNTKQFIHTEDITQPSTPSNVLVTKSGLTSVFASFDASIDNESGINNYVFGIGTAPNLADIKWWQNIGSSASTPVFSLANLGIPNGSTFYITIYAINGVGIKSKNISSTPIQLNSQNYGDTSNNISIQYATYGYDTNGTTIISGWSSAQINKYNNFITKMLPILKEVYGPPSHSYTVTLVRDLYYSGSNIFFPGSNEIHKDDQFLPQLLTHELVHAFRDDVILSMDSNWNYNSKLSGFEESFAQGVSYICMNKYNQLYPNDSAGFNTFGHFSSSVLWDYDFHNTDNITTEDLWSDDGGMLLNWERYEVGAAAMQKIYLEDSTIFNKFNKAYYIYLNNNPTATPTRNLVVNLFSSIISKIEDIPTNYWINKQRIFDCKINPGSKIWVKTQHYPWSNYIIFHTIYYYETFSNGSDWAYYDTTSSSYVYYNLNGSTGLGVTNDYSNSILKQKNLTTSLYTNGYGWDNMSFSTDNDLSPWPGGDTSNYVLNMHKFGMYKLQTNFNATSNSVYRIIGDTLNNTTGIFGGILNAKGGKVYVTHNGYPNDSALNIINGAFWGSKQWASLSNIQTGYKDSKPGKVIFKYVDSLGTTYQTISKNIDWGSTSGNQLFLLDVKEMICTNLSTPTIMANNLVLSSSSSLDNQWYFNGNIILGATNQTYTVSQNGSYSVALIDSNGCSKTSLPYIISTVGISNFHENKNILIFPNPSNGLITIQSINVLGTITIYNALGQLVAQQTTKENTAEVNISDQAAGFYLIKIGNSLIKVIKQ